MPLATVARRVALEHEEDDDTDRLSFASTDRETVEEPLEALDLVPLSPGTILVLATTVPREGPRTLPL